MSTEISQPNEPIFQAQSLRYEHGFIWVYSPAGVPDWPITHVDGERLTDGRILATLTMRDPDGGHSIWLRGEIEPWQFDAIREQHREHRRLVLGPSQPAAGVVTPTPPTPPTTAS